MGKQMGKQMPSKCLAGAGVLLRTCFKQNPTPYPYPYPYICSYVSTKAKVCNAGGDLDLEIER